MAPPPFRRKYFNFPLLFSFIHSYKYTNGGSRMLKKTIAVAGLSFLLVAPSNGAENRLSADKSCGALTEHLKLIREDQLRNQSYSLYRYDDVKREKAVGQLEVKDGRGSLQNSTKMTLTEAERLWGQSRQLVIHVSPTLPEGEVEPDCKIFDLVARGNNNHPMFFYIIAKFEKGFLSQYAVDGPGIRSAAPIKI